MKENLALFKNVDAEYKHCALLAPFRLFYNLQEDDKTPKVIEYHNRVDMPDYIYNILKLFYDAYRVYVDEYNLMNPLQEGIYFDKGAKFIDVMITETPAQRGLVASGLTDNSDFFKENTLMHGKAVKILLDNNLINNSATPIHELFHVIQYNYCNFNNMWFMEGLARWSQNISHERANIYELLPSTISELNYLLTRAHDAEYFWRRLIDKYDKNSNFVKILLEQCALQSKILEDKFKKENRYNINSWSKDDKKSSLNNSYIFQAIADTTDLLSIQPDEELQAFINTIKEYKNIFKTGVVNLADLNEKELKEIELLQEIDGDLVIESTNLRLLNSFNNLKKVNTIKITNNEYLTEILGFNSLESVKNIEISNNVNLEKIYAFFKFFCSVRKIQGYIKISSNKKLDSVLFLRGLTYVGSSLYLHHNNLISIKGLEDLEEVNASLSLSSNKISDLSPLKKLKKINGMLGIAYNQLISLKGLENLKTINVVKWNSKYKSITIEGNENLEDISALKNIQSSTKHYILHIDKANKYSITPDKNSIFYKQSIAVMSSSGEIDTKTIFSNYIKSKNPKILFTDTWINTIAKAKGIDAHFLEFKDINNIIDYMSKHGIIYIFAQVISAQKFLHKHKNQLADYGIKFILNDKLMLDTFVNKKKFYEFMIDENMQEYVPKYYKNIDDVKFPAIIKSETGANGKNMEIIYKKSQLLSCKITGVISEYIADTIEYASHIFSKGDKILTSFTYKKTSLNKYYIMKQNTNSDVKLETMETPFKEIFSKILSTANKENGYSLCCIDYKIVDNTPKIFEINPRLGFTLAKNSNNFEDMIYKYIEECNNE